MIDVTCAVILKAGKIIVTQRSEKMSLPKKWEFPGGKLEKDENPINCIKRELKEELNIEVTIIQKLSNNIHDYGKFQINLIPFVVKWESGEIILSEHSDYKLLDKSELQALDWAAADLPILEELLNTNL